MSVRLFVGYFLALAACATIAFASSEAGSPAPPAVAEAGLMPPPFSSSPAAVFHTHSRKLVLKRTQLAEAQ